MNIMDDVRLKQYPCVVLQNCLSSNFNCKYTKSINPKVIKPRPQVISADGDEHHHHTKYNTRVKKRKRCADCDAPQQPEKLFGDSLNGLLTPVPSSCEEDGSDAEQSNSSKRVRTDELEVEDIVGYYRDKRDGSMSYLVKWKNYDSSENTWEPVENLTNCNEMLMKHFEWKKPTKRKLMEMDREVCLSLAKNFSNIVRADVTRNEILHFPRYGTLDLRKIFTNNLRWYQKTLSREYFYIIRCLIGMRYHRDAGMFLRAQHYKAALKLCELRKEQLKTLESQEREINELEKCPIRIFNEWDFEVLPNVEYITESKAGAGVEIPTEPVMSCDCPDGCRPDSKCCGYLNESEFVYNMDKILHKSRHYPIYECNKKCKCSDDCPNRVVQRGRTKELAIFKTEKCGWGVKTLERIKKGEFVCEYVGELISDSESNAREVEYCPKNLSYMFNLDFLPNGEEAPYVLDATKCGNVSRYLNHSCDPNVEVRVVWVDCLDPYKPRLGFFAKRRINKGEELSFEYTSDEKQGSFISKTRCYCDKSNCREWIWGI